MEEALENSVILRHLFGFLSTPDLLFRCSLVNKRWNSEARSFIRDTRKCFAVTFDSNQETSLHVLNDDLRRMSSRPVPYNGLYLNIRLHMCTIHGEPERTVCHCSPDGNLDFIEGEWPLKYLKIRWEQFDEELGYCPCAKLFPTLLTKNTETLEELILEVVPEVRGRDLGQRSEKYAVFDGLFGIKTGDANAEDAHFCYIELPNLKRLKWPVLRPEILVDSKIMGQLLRCGTPRLQELVHHFVLPHPHSFRSIPEGKLGLLKQCTLVFQDDDALRPNNGISELLAAKPKLRDLGLFADRPEYWPVILELLRQSSDTLKQVEFHWDLAEAIPAKAGDMPVLCKVNDVRMHMNPLLLEGNQNYRDYMASINFTRLFPLSSGPHFCLTVTLLGSRSRRPVWTSQKIPEGSEGGAAVIRRLNVITNAWRDVSRLAPVMPHLSEMFPNVEAVSIQIVSEGLDPSLWTNWKKLRSLKLRLKMRRAEENFENWNFDAAFCGIHPEEVAELRRMDEEYLTRVHIVPCWTPLSYFQDLQNLEIEFGPRKMLSPTESAHLPQVISKVSKFLVFKRIPNLKVTFKGGPLFSPRLREDPYVAFGVSRESAEEIAASAGVKCQIV